MCINYAVIVHIHGHTCKSAGMHKALIALSGRLSIALISSSETPGCKNGGACTDCACGVNDSFAWSSKHVHGWYG